MHCLSRTPRSYLVNSYSDVKENDKTKRESYEATWLDLVMETRPEYKTTLVERDCSRKESFEQKQVAHVVVRRSPARTLCVGRDRAELRQYHLPYKNLPIPIFVPRDVTALADANREPSPSYLQSITDLEMKWNEKSDAPRRSPEFRASRLISPPGGATRGFQLRA